MLSPWLLGDKAEEELDLEENRKFFFPLSLDIPYHRRCRCITNIVKACCEEKFFQVLAVKALWKEL